MKRVFALRWTWLMWLLVPLLLWLSLRGVPLGEIWTTLRGLTLWQLGMLAAINLVIFFLFALRWRLILGALGHPIPLLQVIAYRLAGFGVTYFTPGPQFGGEPLQVLLLQRRAGVPVQTAISSVFLDKLVELLANFAFLVVGFWVALSGGVLPGDLSPKIGWVAGILFAIPVIHLAALWTGRRPLTALAVALAARLNRAWMAQVSTIVRQAEEQAGRFCRAQPAALVRLFLVAALAWVLSLIEFSWMLAALGAPLEPMRVVSLMVALRLAFLLPMPSGLGAMEAALVFGGQMVGIPPAAALSAALLIRARDITLGLVGLWIGGWSLKARIVPPGGPQSAKEINL